MGWFDINIQVEKKREDWMTQEISLMAILDDAAGALTDAFDIASPMGLELFIM